MNFSDIKTIKNFCADTIGCDEWRDVVLEIDNGETDFEAGDYRFIEQNSIDQIQQDELENDAYILGCFNANFLSSVLGAPETAIKGMQEAEAFEALGQWVIDDGKIEQLQSDYSSTDGYGHHFASYDGNEHDLSGLDDFGDYYAFKIN